MHRRSFIKRSSLYVIAVSTSGFIRFDGTHYIGDCETTSDVLGPFYRPGSPERNNLVLKGDVGDLVELSGVIRHNDCRTPYKQARIELWHCNNKGFYDNKSDEYQYRGTTYSDNDGHYIFNTVLPVPYDIGGGNMRPAHFHLMITAAGYQPFITQLYFSGDHYISKDPFASSPNAKKRILAIQTVEDKTRKVLFDVTMSPKPAADPSEIHSLTGIYTDEKDKVSKLEFFEKDNLLWKKNEVYGEVLEYTGDNSFQYPNGPAGMSLTLVFEKSGTKAVKVTQTFINEKAEKHITVATR